MVMQTIRRTVARFAVRDGRRVSVTAIESRSTATTSPVAASSRFGVPSTDGTWLAHRDGCRCTQAGCA